MSSLTLLETQGYSNKTYKYKEYIVKKLNGSHIEQKKEFSTALEAYNNGIGAEPILLDTNNSLITYRFLKGKHKQNLKKEDIKNIALLLKKLHKIKIEKKLFNFKKDYVLCHHDLNPQNFIFSNDIKLIDWEYARLNSRYFDLASVIVEFNLNKQKEKLFLKAYFKNRYQIDIKKVSIFKKSYILLCTKWFTKQNNQKEKMKYIKKL